MRLMRNQRVCLPSGILSSFICGLALAVLALVSFSAFAPNAQAARATYRYYRFTVTANDGDAYNQLSELHYYSEGAWVQATTVTSAQSGGDGPPSNLNDANQNSKFGTGTMPYAVTYDFGVATALDSYNWATANDTAPARNPTMWKVEGSTDNATWVMLDDRTGVSQGTGPTATFTWAGNNTGFYVLVGQQDGGAFNAWPLAPAVQSIGVNFQGRNYGAGVLPATAIAGVVPQANWNNDSGGDPAFVNKVVGPLVDSTGAATPITLTFSANDSWSSDGCTGVGNCDMMKGHIKAGTGSTASFVLANVPLNGLYDLLIYDDVNNGGAIQTDFAVQDTVVGAITNYVLEFNSFNAPFGIPQRQFNPAGARANGYYMVFQNVVPDGSGNIHFTMKHVSGGDGSAMPGFQLVPRAAYAPLYVVRPLNGFVQGSAFTVSVLAGPLASTYQWYTNGVPVTEANSASYSDITPANLRSIYCRVTNSLFPAGIQSETLSGLPFSATASWNAAPETLA